MSFIVVPQSPISTIYQLRTITTKVLTGVNAFIFKDLALPAGTFRNGDTVRFWVVATKSGVIDRLRVNFAYGPFLFDDPGGQGSLIRMQSQPGTNTVASASLGVAFAEESIIQTVGGFPGTFRAGNSLAGGISSYNSSANSFSQFGWPVPVDVNTLPFYMSAFVSGSSDTITIYGLTVEKVSG